MKKLALMLAAVAVGLALACAYLVNQVDVERGRTRAEADRRQELETRVQQIEREQLAAARKASDVDVDRAGSPREELSAQPVLPAGNVAPDENETHSLQVADDQRARRRQMLEDPASRDLLRASAIAALRAANPDLAHDLGLTPDECDRLLALVVEQSLQREDMIADGMTDSRMDELDELSSTQKMEVVNLLGAEKAQQYEEYMVNQPMRAQVRRLRARLGENNALRDDQSARLVTVLQNARARFAEELREQYAGETLTFSMMGWDGGDFVASDTKGTSAEEQVLAQMEDYNHRIVRGAASVLTASQLKVFTQLQDEILAMQRVQLRGEVNPAEE